MQFSELEEITKRARAITTTVAQLSGSVPKVYCFEKALEYLTANPALTEKVSEFFTACALIAEASQVPGDLHPNQFLGQAAFSNALDHLRENYSLSAPQPPF